MNATLVSKMIFWALYIERFWIIYFELIYWTVYWSCVFIVFYILSCILIIFCTECQMVGHKAQLIQLPIKGDFTRMEKYHKPIQHFWLWWKHMILYNIYIYILYSSRCFSQVFRSVTCLECCEEISLDTRICSVQVVNGRKSLGFPSPVFVRIVSHLLIIYFLYFLH